MYIIHSACETMQLPLLATQNMIEHQPTLRRVQRLRSPYPPFHQACIKGLRPVVFEPCAKDKLEARLDWDGRPQEGVEMDKGEET
jgi:hypothetical protein